MDSELDDQPFSLHAGVPSHQRQAPLKSVSVRTLESDVRVLGRQEGLDVVCLPESQLCR